MQQEKSIIYSTTLGMIRGVENERCVRFLGVPYARAARFAYAEPLEHWNGELNATGFGFGCP